MSSKTKLIARFAVNERLCYNWSQNIRSVQLSLRIVVRPKELRRWRGGIFVLVFLGLQDKGEGRPAIVGVFLCSCYKGKAS